MIWYFPVISTTASCQYVGQFYNVSIITKFPYMHPSSMLSCLTKQQNQERLLLRWPGGVAVSHHNYDINYSHDYDRLYILTKKNFYNVM